MNFYRFCKVHQRWCVHVSSKFGCIRCCWVITLFFKECALHTGLVTGLPLLPHLQELGNYLQENNIQMFHTLRQPCILFNAPCFLPLVGHLPSSLLLGSCAADRTTGLWWLTAGQTQCGLNGWTISSCLLSSRFWCRFSVRLTFQELRLKYECHVAVLQTQKTN